MGMRQLNRLRTTLGAHDRQQITVSASSKKLAVIDSRKVGGTPLWTLMDG